MEYQNLYHHENGLSEEACEKRKEEILKEIDETGTYTHTFDELEYGSRAAWRFAPKCANRKFWNELHLLDWRDKVRVKGRTRKKSERKMPEGKKENPPPPPTPTTWLTAILTKCFCR